MPGTVVYAARAFLALSRLGDPALRLWKGELLVITSKL